MSEEDNQNSRNSFFEDSDFNNLVYGIGADDVFY